MTPDRRYRLGILTSGRADYSILTPLLRALNAHRHFDCLVVAFGMHLLPGHEEGLNLISSDGFATVTVGKPFTYETPEDIAAAMGATTVAFSAFYAGSSLDGIVCVGDRYEMMMAVAAAVPFNIPVVHLHGGEETAGAMDDAFRRAITAMADLHLTAHPAYAQRVKNIVGPSSAGRVFSVGAPALDAIAQEQLLTHEEFIARFGVDMSEPTLLATFHPETRRGLAGLTDAQVFAEAIAAADKQIVLTLPNADTYGGGVRQRILAAVDGRPRTHVFEMLGRTGYYSALALCEIVIGNSSSGIIEAASFAKPVVNVGERQSGRLRGPNVIDCPPEQNAILAAIGKAQQLALTLDGINIYGDGQATPRIVAHLEHFFDVEMSDRRQ